MPMGEGRLFLPVKAAIRKKIKKEKGDSVHIILYLDENPLEIPEEIIECFKTESQSVYETFLSFSEGERKTYLDWIYDAKTDETKTQRIVTMMERLQQGLTFRE
ncbi:MAG: YdeI/OmpD-associated family protein, partial [Bacteroidetes bacterium]|nr:YdeI/OmpD-associated family protein [Bacteroidota bacterium]